MTRSHRRTLSLLAAAVVAAGAGLAFDATNALEGAELATVDARFQLRGDQPAPDGVVVVGIDQRSIDAGEGEYPLNRSRDAAVIQRLQEAGASVIAYDVSFADPGDDVDADNEIYTLVSETPQLVLGTKDVGEDGSTGIFGGGEAFEETGATAGNTHLQDDLDGRVRRMEVRPQGLEAFSLAAARLKRGGKLALPPGDSFWIDYPGPAGTLETFSFLDVEQGRVPDSELSGKVVVVGTTAPDRAEFARTPLDERVASPEVHAAAVATALNGFPLAEASGWAQTLPIVILGALGPLLLLFGLRARYAVGATALAALAYLLAAKLAFDSGTLLAVVPGLVAALVGGVAAAAFADPERSPWQAALDRLTHGVRGNLRTRRLRASLLLGAIAATIAGGLILLETDALQRMELSTVNQRFDVRGDQPPPADVVLVAIDERTFVEPPSPRWPFSRRDHARVVRHLEQAGAKVIAYDVQFSEPDRNDPGGDEKLLEATRGAGNVVMATTEVGENGQPNVFFDADSRAYSRTIPAISNLRPDVDGRIRRLPFEFQNRITFALASAQEALGRRIQTPGGDTAWIDYAGSPGTIDTLSFVDVRRGNFDRDAVRGKVVVVGATSTVLQDLHSTSTTQDGLMPGPEIHANAIQTALDDFPLRSAPTWVNWLLVIVMGALTPLIALRRGIVLPVAAGVAALGLLLVAAQLLFNNGTIVAVVYPALVGVVAILASAAIHGLTVAFEREQARDAFARFVPEAVVDQVLADAEGVRLGGVRGEATVMFSDLRGFTSFSESLEPERVIEALNMYLTEMSEAILDHGGTLVAYMGDGIMAVFGAPLKQPDHADRALEAARDMLGRMGKFNGWLREQGLHDGFKMGIGLNSGPVMSGNVGSERRLEYTALGDTTNTAARLEGMTKGTPHQLYIADTTKQMLTRAPDDLAQVGEAEVRGRKAKVLLWSLREVPAAPEPAALSPTPQPAEESTAPS